jgi:hypothetical protein
MYRDTTDVEHEVYDYAPGNWSHRNSNKRLKKNLEAVPGKHSVIRSRRQLYLEHHT